MFSDEKQILMRVVENFVRTGKAADDEVKVVCLPGGKTNFIETIDQDGRSIQLEAYQVDDKVIWAGYSGRSETVYLSSAYSH